MKDKTIQRIKALYPNSLQKNVKAIMSDDVLEIELYGPIEADSKDWWGETVESDTSAKCFKSILDKAKDVKKINLFINSPGGDAWEGQAIHSLLKRADAEVTVYIDGIAASAASVVAMAGDRIVMGPCAELMIHNAWTIAMGNANDLRQVADGLDKTSTAMKEAYLLKTNGKIDEAKLSEMLDNETFLTARECLEYGFCDEIEGVTDQDLEQAKAQVLEKETIIKQLQAKLEAYEKQNTDSEPALKKGWFFHCRKEDE